MKISIVVCAYSGIRFTDALDALKSLDNQDYSNLEIILVVDRNDELHQRFQKHYTNKDVILLLNKDAGGLSAARNLGLENASGEIIAYLDDDAIADKNWLKTIVATYENDDAVIAAGGKILPRWLADRPIWFPDEFLWVLGCTHLGHPTDMTEIRNTFGSNISFRREVFDKIGVFSTDVGRVDDKAFTAEEMEMSVRVKMAYPDMKIMYNPEAIVYHKVFPERVRFRYFVKRVFGDGRSKARVKSSLSGNKKILSTEKGFLRFLLGKSIPGRLKRALLLSEPVSNLKQCLAIITGLIIFGTGYSIERVKHLV